MPRKLSRRPRRQEATQDIERSGLDRLVIHLLVLVVFFRILRAQMFLDRRSGRDVELVPFPDC